MNTNPENANNFVLMISYMGLVLGIFFIIHSPIIILNMNVNFKQLLFNSIVLIFGGFKNSLICIILIGGYIILGIYVPYSLFLMIYFIPIILCKFPYRNLLKFKALKLNTTVEELTKKENQDDYLNEYGYVNHSD